MTALWERSDDGRQWHDWMHINFTRETQPLSPKPTTTHQEARP